MSAAPPGRRPGERVFAALLVAGSLFMLWQAWRISGFESITSAGVFPMIAAAVMVVTGAIAFAASWRSRRGAAADTAPGRFADTLVPPAVLGFVVAIVPYVLLLERLGFVVASFLFLLLSMRLLGSRRWGLNLVTSVVAMAAIYLVFRTAFSVVLPAGSWLQGWWR